MGIVTSLKQGLVGFGALRLLILELRRMNRLGEELVDELRLAGGRLPKYAKPAESTPSPIEKDFTPAVYVDEDYATAEYLREIARMEGVYVDELTDIHAVARERGWEDEDGTLRV